MQHIYADTLDAISLFQASIPKGWKVTVSVPPDEVGDVWPVLLEYSNKEFLTRGALRNWGELILVPMV